MRRHTLGTRLRIADVPKGTIVLEFHAVRADESDMAEVVDAGAPVWPPLPNSCPCDGAKPMTATVYRLSDPDDPLDCGLPFERYSAEWYGGLDDHDRCRAHSLSVFNSLDEIRRRRRVQPKKFGNHKILEIEIDDQMGVLWARERDPRHSWWPSETVVPPVQGKEVD